MKQLILKVGMAGLGVAALSALPFIAQAQAKQCSGTMVWGYGIHHTKAIARNKARRAWRGNTQASLGSSWSLYILARNKTSGCRKWHKDMSKWNCFAKGKPCRNGPGKLSP